MVSGQACMYGRAHSLDSVWLIKDVFVLQQKGCLHLKLASLDPSATLYSIT